MVVQTNDKSGTMIQNSNILQGYKDSSLGIIPEEWEVKRLGEISIKIGSGVTPRGGDSVYKKTGRYFLRSQNIGWGILLLDDVAFIDENTHKKQSSTEIIKNDVLLNITGASIGRCAIANNTVKGGNVNQHVCIIRIKEKILPYYINSFLLSEKGQKLIESFQAGGNRQGLNFEHIKSFQIPLPPLPEQQKIAEILTVWDNAIDIQTRLIASLQKRKRGLMQQLLTGKKRLKGFDGEWKEVKLGDVTYLQGGYAFKSELFSDKGTPVIRISDIYNDKISVNNSVYSASINIPKDFTIKNGDILIAMSGATTGKIGIYKLELTAYLNQRVGKFVIINHDLTSQEFVSYIVRSEKFMISLSRLLEQGAQPNISGKQIESIICNIPKNKEEQIAIAEILSAADKEIDFFKKKLTSLKEQKMGLLQVLLTGKKRVKSLK